MNWLDIEIVIEILYWKLITKKIFEEWKELLYIYCYLDPKNGIINNTIVIFRNQKKFVYIL